MKRSFRGVLTVFLSLVMLLFLSFCLVLTEGSRMYFFKAKAEQAVSLAEFSALSEYQPQLLENYGLFFLDLDYGQGKEQTTVLHNRIKGYLAENAGEVSSYSLNVRNFRRATDGGGSVFFRQAVEAEKFKSGIGLLEKVLPDSAGGAEPIDLGRELADQEAEAAGILSQLTDEEGKPLFKVSIPHISFPDAGALMMAVFGEGIAFSDVQIVPSERISGRQLRVGSGEETKKSFADMQLFHRYVLEHCGYYGKEPAGDVDEVPDYQLEYIIAGGNGDRENLQIIMWRIFLLRSAGNYVLSHQDAEKQAKAEAKALAAVGVTGNVPLIEAVKELFLLAEAVEDGIGETRKIFSGGKVPVFGEGVLSGMEMDYRDYLLLFLQTTGEKEMIYRSMDMIELEVRKLSGNENFRFDHCTDCFQMEWTYEFDSLFLAVPLLEGGVYRNKITRKMYYEM